MLYQVLPDPRAYRAAKGKDELQVLQFHRLLPDPVPIGHFEEGGIEVVDDRVSRSVYLDWIQEACARLGDHLEIRFFNHMDEVFDASVLDHLDQVRHLSIDGLMHMCNPEAVGRLPRLTSLRFGAHRIENARILAAVGVHRLTRFTLASSPTPTIDLAPLGEASALQTLRLLGNGKNMDAAGRIASLTEFAFQPSSKVPLDFINRLAALQSLKFVLGNIETISAITGLPALRDLSFREVRNLKDLGDLQRFPQLRRLQVSDQPKIATLKVGARNAALKHIYLYSVPQLETLEGVSALPAVKSLFAYNSRLALPWSALPHSLTHFRLMTKVVKGRDVHEAEVRAKGLIPAVHPDATFFYK